MGFADMWQLDGTIGRGKYALTGVLAFAVKFVVDRFVAMEVFHRVWLPWNYVLFPWRPNVIGIGNVPANPALGPWVRTTPGDEAAFAVTMLAIAVPFIWLGVTLTVQRLRDAGQPLWLVVLFFVPVINLLFLFLLCAMGTHPLTAEWQAAPWPATHVVDSWIPRSKTGAALVAIAATAVSGLAFVALSTQVLKTYGSGLFVAAPFCLGLFSALVYSYHEPRDWWQCLMVSLVPILLLGGVLVIVALEGIICILMAAPFAAGLAAFGGAIGYAIQAGYWKARQAPAVLSIVLLFTPGFAGVEQLLKPQPRTFVVKSALEVNAPPEVVWKEVVSFSEIAPPIEMIFRAGIAYPMRAEMIGSGVGAERHCVFSTGAFVEPIHVWDAPRLLRFGVSENPPPMHEITPYAHVHAPHLHGYFVSTQGQFLLTALPGGRTRLEGTTWYSHTMWPEMYWHLWSDYVIHRIHMRVLEHIKREVEKGAVNGD
jgi:uncharacterized membrane protein YhaH (DUF805 family)